MSPVSTPGRLVYLDGLGLHRWGGDLEPEIGHERMEAYARLAAEDAGEPEATYVRDQRRKVWVRQ